MRLFSLNYSFPGIIYLNPISIRVFKPDLFYAINAQGDSTLFAGPILIGNMVFIQAGDKLIYRGNGEAEVGIFIMRHCFSGSADDVQMTFRPDAEPGMAAIMKGFGNGVETNYIAIETRTFFEVHYINGNVIKSGHRFGLSVAKLGDNGEAGEKEQPGKTCLFHYSNIQKEVDRCSQNLCMTV